MCFRIFLRRFLMTLPTMGPRSLGANRRPEIQGKELDTPSPPGRQLRARFPTYLPVLAIELAIPLGRHEVGA